MNEQKPVAVVDEESATKVGDVATVVARFDTPEEAERFVADHSDQEKVARGGFGIDVPESMWPDVRSDEREPLVIEPAPGNEYDLNRCDITFLINVTNVLNLSEAIDVAAVALARQGMDAFYILATDPDTGRQWVVHNGETTNAEEISDEIEDIELPPVAP